MGPSAHCALLVAVCARRRMRRLLIAGGLKRLRLGRHHECAVDLDRHAALEEINRDHQESLVGSTSQ